MPDFTNYSLPLNVLFFTVAAAAVWIAGTRIANYADEIGSRYNLNEAVLGLVLLAGVTSLPEIATSLTAAHAGDAKLAVNNLLGSIAMQIAVLAVADFAVKHAALTSVLPDPVVILQGALNVLLLAVVAFAVLSGDAAFAGAGYWTWGLVLATCSSFWILGKAQSRPPPWLPQHETAVRAKADSDTADEEGSPERSATGLFTATVIASLVILVAGSIVAKTGMAIANESGLGSSFMGVAFVAIATSLPEVSTSLSAARLGLYVMAISDILGTNLLNIALLFAVDLVAPGDPVFNGVGTFAAAGALLGIVVTAIFLLGIAERRDRTFLRLGYDSCAVVLVYLGGMAVLYTMRDVT